MSQQLEAKKFVMTNKVLVREYYRAHARIDKAYAKLESMPKFRDMRPSDMRNLAEQPFPVKQLLKQIDFAAELRAEAEARFGPGMVVVDQLIWKTK